MINLIAAIGLNNNGIGYKGDLLTRLPNDLKHFKSLTEGHFTVMGRNTYESIGKPLPNRTNIVLSTDPKIEFHPDVCIYSSVEEIIHDYEVHAEEQVELFICGGQKVYEEFLPIADRIYLTIIQHEFDAVDTYFPRFSLDDYKPVEREHNWADDKNEYDHVFVTYERKNKIK